MHRPLSEMEIRTSYEIKNRLTAIMLQSEIAKRKIDLGIKDACHPEKFKEFIAKTHDEIFRLNALIDRMLSH